MKLEDVKSSFGDRVTDEDCQAILDLVEGKIEFKGVDSQQGLIMIAINDLIVGFGVEAIQDPDNSDNVLAIYVNTGETYSNTVVYDKERSEYVLTTWGDWIEWWYEKELMAYLSEN